MTAEDIEFLREYAKCGIYHNYMHYEDELNARLKRLSSILDTVEKLQGEKQILESLREDAETRVRSWENQYYKLKQEMENVSDFFAKYQRRVI